MDQLPDIIELDKLPPEKIQEAKNRKLSDIINVGPQKPFGLLPTAALRVMGQTPEKIAANAKTKGLNAEISNYALFDYLALQVWDPSAVNAILKQPENVILIQKAKWPNEPRAFIKKLSTDIAPDFLDSIVDQLFVVEEPISSPEGTINNEAIMNFIYAAASNFPAPIDKALNKSEQIELAKRMSMNDIIRIFRPYAVRSRLAGILARHTVTSVDEELLIYEGRIETTGGMDALKRMLTSTTPISVLCLHPLLKHTRDFDEATARQLLYEENKFLCANHPTKMDEYFQRKNIRDINRIKLETGITKADQNMLEEDEKLIQTQSDKAPVWINDIKPYSKEKIDFPSILSFR